jgi:siroheme synthase-like protein
VALSYFPIALNLKGKLAVIAGGGKVAQRKADSFLISGAKLHVVSPELTPRLRKLVEARKIKWTNRTIRASDLKSADIIIAATSDKKANEDVSRWARKLEVPVNVVDRPRSSDFISPAILRISSALVAVYTDGKDPVLSRDLKNFLKENWDVFLSYRRRS